MKYVKEKITKIVDEADGHTVSVIVQLNGGRELTEVLRTASSAVERRRSIVSARDLLPSLLGDAKRRARPQAAKRPGPARAAAKRTSAKEGAPGGQATGGRIDVGQSRFDLLRSSSWLAALGSSAKKRRRTEPATFLRSSGAVVVTLTRDELARLPEDLIENIRDINPNREVRVPPIARSTGLPRAVSDARGHTWGIARTGAMACWGAFGARGKDVRVAVLDTGVDAKHPDLQGKIAGFAEFDMDGNLTVGGVAKAYDSDMHGTHCAGTIVGGNASNRFIGMAPDAQILAGLVLKNGIGYDAQILAGIDWAIDQGADVISMSLGGLSFAPDVLDTYTSAIISANDAGIPVVVAVGNEGAQTTGAPGNDYFAFTVGATDIEDRAAGFSGGRTQVIAKSRYIEKDHLPLVYMKPDIVAPGVDVYSTVPKQKWDTFSGSSMATPHVAGAMALLLSASTSLAQMQRNRDRVDALQTLLISTVKELGEAGQNHRYGYGRLDVLRAMGYAHYPSQ